MIQIAFYIVSIVYSLVLIFYSYSPNSASHKHQDSNYSFPAQLLATILPPFLQIHNDITCNGHLITPSTSPAEESTAFHINSPSLQVKGIGNKGKISVQYRSNQLCHLQWRINYISTRLQKYVHKLFDEMPTDEEDGINSSKENRVLQLM